MRFLLALVILAGLIGRAFMAGLVSGLGEPERPPYVGPERRRRDHNRGGCDLD